MQTERVLGDAEVLKFAVQQKRFFTKRKDSRKNRSKKEQNVSDRHAGCGRGRSFDLMQVLPIKILQRIF